MRGLWLLGRVGETVVVARVNGRTVRQADPSYNGQQEKGVIGLM